MTTVQHAYRDDAAIARLRYDEQVARWDSTAASLSSAAEVHVARSGRIAAGWAGIVGTVTLLVVALLMFLILGLRPSGILGSILAAIWVAMAIAHRVARRGAAARAARAAVAPAPTDDPWADLAALAALPPGAALHSLAASQERDSASLPLIALSLLLPLSIHGALFAVASVATGSLPALVGFDYWICFCAVVVGHAHIGLACFGRDFASRLATIRDEDLLGEAERRASKAYWWTVLIAAIPGAVLILLPPILTAVTGALFCGAMFRGIAMKILQERKLLGAAPAA
jgi:hypothetical protein